VPRRILLLITDLEIGGTPTVVRELATRLSAPPEVEVEVACLKGWGPVVDQLRAAGIPVTAFDVQRVAQLRTAVRRLRDLVRERGIDTVLSFLVHANVVAAAASKRLPGVRFLQSVQTVQPWPRWHWVAQRWAARRAERVVVPSTAIAAFAGRRSGIAAERFVVIPNAVDAEAFPRVEVFRGAVIRAGYLGRLDPAKSPGLLLTALRAAGMEERAELHYFGDGSERAALEAEAGRMGLAGRVRFHGVVARPQEALAGMDVLWQPSAVEGFGLVVIEAMASGVPVVSRGVGGVLDVVRDGENGLLAEERSPHHVFASSLWRLRDEVGLRERLIENGVRTVGERFTWEAVLPRYRELLELG
jgi:glycosyltransferase involved in cell wall biosynthesis